MKTMADFAILGSLILTLWMSGGVSRVKHEKNPQAAPAAAEKLGANHNEILVKDVDAIKPEGLLSPLQKLPLEDPQPATSSDCTWLECGHENAASLALDTQKARETKPQATWLTNVWEFFFRGTRPPCEDWGCGMNHNETLAKDRDPAEKEEIVPKQVHKLILIDLNPIQPPDCVWLECGPEIAASMKIDNQTVRGTKPQASWLTSVWDFFFKGTRPPGGCDDWGCGMNHNETLARSDR